MRLIIHDQVRWLNEIQLSREEANSLRFQIGILKAGEHAVKVEMGTTVTRYDYSGNPNFALKNLLTFFIVFKAIFDSSSVALSPG